MSDAQVQSLRFLINAAIWTVCVVILLLFGFLFYIVEKNYHQNQIEQVKTLLNVVYQQKREALANEIFAKHHEALAHSLNEIKAIKGVSAVYVFDLRGALLGFNGFQDRKVLTGQQRRQLDQNAWFQEVVIEHQPFLHFGTSIEAIGERIGYLTVYFDLADLEQISKQRMGLIVAVFSSLMVVLSVVLHILLTRMVVMPVSRLRSAMGLVMKGQLGEQVELQRRDEIGQVAEAFNAMSTQLKEQHKRLTRSMAARDSYAEQLELTNQELARLNTNLETIVEERTCELRSSYEKLQAEIQERIRAHTEKRALEEQLSRSKKMEALGLLAGGVAHDLNNVLSGIVSYPDLILEELNEDTLVKNMVLAIRQSGEKAAAIVQDLLTLARRGVTHRTVMNLNHEVITDYLDSPEFSKLRSIHPNVVVETDLAEDLMYIKGSGIHLKKAVMNLVINSAESQPQGGRILITTENRYVDRPISSYGQVHEGDYVVLRIQDFGTGIAPNELDRIFEPFYTKKVMGRSGTGLGMAVVWGTVQDHKGYINVESQLDQGTCFEIFLPVTREKPKDKRKSTVLEDCLGNGETVLVVDDVVEQREIATNLLNRLKYRVITASSGEDAVTYLQNNKADILVLDMIMDPGMDGLDTYAQIIKMHPNQKAIIASGYAEDARVKKAQALGVGTYLRKPYTLEKIGMALRNELAR